MLLRQALEQTRAGLPPPVQFNFSSRILVLDAKDEVPATVHIDVFGIHLRTVHHRANNGSSIRGTAGQVAATGALAS